MHHCCHPYGAATSFPYLILFDAQAVKNKAKTITRTICHPSVFYPTCKIESLAGLAQIDYCLKYNCRDLFQPTKRNAQHHQQNMYTNEFCLDQNLHLLTFYALKARSPHSHRTYQPQSKIQEHCIAPNQFCISLTH